jgi:hypothetical protein
MNRTESKKEESRNDELFGQHLVRTVGDYEPKKEGKKKL